MERGVGHVKEDRPHIQKVAGLPHLENRVWSCVSKSRKIGTDARMGQRGMSEDLGISEKVDRYTHLVNGGECVSHSALS